MTIPGEDERPCSRGYTPWEFEGLESLKSH